MSVIDVKKPFQRLPKDVVPLHYKITLKPDLVKFVFTGSEVVHVKVVKSTSDIILNVKEIDITEATYSQSKDGSGAIKGSVTIEKNNDKAIIKFSEALKTGEGYLKLVFKGIHNDKMAGFYRTKYKSPVTGQETYAVTTQFEATDARRAFPCWDEPAIKARFEVTIIGPKDRVILSNTNVAKEEDDPSDPKLRIVHFEPTPIMSTYLLCFIVGEFESISSKTSRGIKVRVFTQFGKLNQGSFALNDGVKYIEFFEDYFKIPYPLNKLDHIAIPDFAFNAMENWGLVTYRESALLVDPEATSFSSKQNISMVIAHETAHQWFGNLVTMEWWTHLWLNEGFASFMQYLAVESNHPDFEYWKQFAVASSIEALDIDCSHRSHAIEIPVGAPEEISSIFDHISYHKGASVIRMCYSWINDQCFRMGMKNYLTEHAYKNAVTEELWKALEVASKKPVEKMMPSWTGQMGYPVINVNIVNQDSKTVLTLSQERFTINGKLDGKESKQLWMIPISLITSNKPKEEQKFDLLKDKTMQISIDQVPTNGWIKLNPSMYGFYRVNYPISMWKALGEGVKSKTLSPLDRLAVIDDLTALCFAGKVSAIEVFKMLEFYANEDDYVSWAGVDRALERIGTLLAYTDLYKGFQNFARKLVLHAFEKLGFDKKPDERCTNSLMRSLVISRLIQLKDEKVLHECKKRFDSHVQNKNLAADLRASVYKAVTKLGDTNDHEALFKLYHETELQEEKLRIAVALGASNNEHKIDQVLKFAFSEHVRNQNAWQVILGVTGTVKGRELAWKFYKHNIKEIKERFGSHRSSAILIQKTTENFACEEMAKEVSSFFEKHPFAGLEDVIARAIERIHVNSDWLKRESGSLKDYLTV